MLDIRGFTKERRYALGQLDNKNLRQLLSIFFESYVDKDHKEKYTDPVSGRKSYFELDFSVSHNGQNLVFEYDGPPHYTDVNKIERDVRKRQFLDEKGYSFITIPYYLQFTRDVAVHYFGKKLNVFSEEKYMEMLRAIYGTEDENRILSPGWHSTKDTPANFVKLGAQRFFSEVAELPESVKCQLVHSLRLYMKRSNGKEYLIIPLNDEAFGEFMDHEPKPEHLNYFFKSDVK